MTWFTAPGSTEVANKRAVIETLATGLNLTLDEAETLVDSGDWSEYPDVPTVADAATAQAAYKPVKSRVPIRATFTAPYGPDFEND